MDADVAVKRPAPVRCGRCHKPIHKGENVVVMMFARHVGVVDGAQTTEPWLTVVAHLREACMGLTPEVMREARRARVAPRQMKEVSP